MKTKNSVNKPKSIRFITHDLDITFEVKSKEHKKICDLMIKLAEKYHADQHMVDVRANV